MILCPKCQNIEISGALFCSECGAILVNLAGPLPNSVPEPSPMRKTEQQATTLIPALPAEAQVALVLIGKGVLLPLAENHEFTLGRSIEKQLMIPDVDLGPYGGYEEGVSRLHASIKITDTVTVTDLGSINGTRVNGQLIPPNAPHTLHNEDLLTLGRMKVQVLVRNR